MNRDFRARRRNGVPEGQTAPDGFSQGKTGERRFRFGRRGGKKAKRDRLCAGEANYKAGAFPAILFKPGNREGKQQLKELEAMAEGRTQHLTGMPIAPGFGDKTARYAIEMMELKETIQSNVRRCFAEYTRLLRFIRGVEDSRMRQILTLRYRNGMTWQRIAMEIGGGNTEDSVRKNARQVFGSKIKVVRFVRIAWVTMAVVKKQSASFRGAFVMGKERPPARRADSAQRFLCRGRGSGRREPGPPGPTARTERPGENQGGRFGDGKRAAENIRLQTFCTKLPEQ